MAVLTGFPPSRSGPNTFTPPSGQLHVTDLAEFRMAVTVAPDHGESKSAVRP